MTGEYAAWYMIADELKMTKQRCQAETTSTEYLDWVIHFNRKKEQHDKIEYYHAKICMLLKAIYYMWSGENKNLSIPDELLNFSATKETITTEETITVTKKVKKRKSKKVTQKQIDITQQVVFAAVGLNPDGSCPEVIKTKKPPV